MNKIVPVLLLTFAMPLAAETQGKGPPDPAQMAQGFIQQLDADKDGKVSLQEFTKPSEQQFRQMDRSGDGFVTAEEAQAVAKDMQQRVQEMQKQMQQRGQSGQPGGGGGQDPQR